MEADEVYDKIMDKLSTINDKLDNYGDRITTLQDAFRDIKDAAERARSDIQQINDTLSGMKSGVESLKQDTTKQTQSFADQQKKIEEANAISEKKYQEQQGLIGKLAAQAEDAGKTLMNLGDTTNAIVKKAWDDGKKEILNIWDDSKKEILNSMSSVTTKIIKDEKEAIAKEIKEELRSLVFDDVKTAQDEAKASKPELTDEALEEKIRKIVKESMPTPA